MRAEVGTLILLSNRLLGQIFSFVFRFLAYLSSCTFFSSFVHRYFVNYAPLLRAVCKFSYIVCCLQPPRQLSSAFVSGFIFIVFFNFVLQWPLGSLSVL